jgi:uncharacterized membrane protein YkvA (DUF1232 family)
MTPPHRPQNTNEALGFLADLVRQIRLFWRLLNDPRVPYWVKAIPALVLLYLIFPIDLIPDPALGLGQLDDLAVILLGLKLFRDLSPRAVVRDHEADIAGQNSPWRVIEDESASDQETQPTYIDAEYRVVEADKQKRPPPE